MSRYRVFCSLFICYIVLFSTNFSLLLAEEAFFELGGESGWSDVSYMHNMTVTKGLYGFDSLELLASPEKKIQDYDLFLSFDGDVSKDNLNLYDVSASNTLYTSKERAKYGTAALSCIASAKDAALVLSPKEGSFFFGNTKMSSFTIEFWLNPEDLRAGSTILKWWSQILEKKAFMFQNIVASIVENRLEWSLFNIWRDDKNRGIDVKISSKNSVPLEKWSHHLLTYDDERGLLEYRVDGQIESIRYMTQSADEAGSIFYSMKGKTSQVFIGEGYSGLIDNFAVKNTFTPQSFEEAMGRFEKYHRNGGRVASRIVDTGGMGSLPKKLDVKMAKSGKASVAFFIRTSNTPYNWTDSKPEWKAIRENATISNCRPGRYFQIAFDVYPTQDGAESPVIHSIKLEYDQDTFAKPPIVLTAKEGDGYVDLEWSRSIDFDVKGYLVFFGEREGEYILPSSPIDAGNSLALRIYNLQNGKLYFFSVAAYDENGKLCNGEFSKEVSMRPLKK